MTYKEGPQRQPDDIRSEQAMATALDRRCKMLYGVLETEHDDVCRALTLAAADIVIERDQQPQKECNT